MRVTSMFYLFNPALSQAFETELCNIDAEAESLFFKRTNEPNREKAIRRWQTSVEQFSPLQVEVTDHIRQLKSAKVAPFWRGADEEQWESLTKKGLFYFGSGLIVSGQRRVSTRQKPLWLRNLLH